MKGSFIRASLVLAGTTIGAGIFGIPYVTAKVGYPLGFLWLILVVIFTLLLNVSYAYIITKTDHGRDSQLVGLAGKHLGRQWRKVALVVVLIGQWSAMLAYIIGVGSFLSVILGLEGGEFFLSIVFFVVMAVITLNDLKLASFLESWLTYGMMLIIAVLAIFAYPKISLANFAANGTSFFESIGIVGVLLGAMTGFAVIPEVRKSLGGDDVNNDKFIWSVIVGTLIPAVVYAIFQFTVVGVSGVHTSESSIAGLVPFLSPVVVIIGALFGVLAMVSSFVALTYVLRDTFQLDFSIPKIPSWILALLPPLLLYLFGLKSFILVLDIGGYLSSFTGSALVFSILMVLLVRLHSKNKRELKA